jgi:hypothetical protein
MRVRVLILAAAAGLAVSAGSSAATQTTGPGYHVNVLVTIDDRGLYVHDQAQMARGAIVTFDVYNGGKKLHSYGLLGKQTGAIKPKKWAHFTVTLLTRGRFPNGSTLDKGPAFHGFYTVF